MNVARRFIGAFVVLATACAPDPGSTTRSATGTRPDGSTPRPSILVFHRTEGFRHDSIGVAAEVLGANLARLGFDVVDTEDPTVFSVEQLARFGAVVFLSTTGDVLDGDGEAALRQWVEAGGGWVGIHAALDTEYDWDFYETLAGARFASHPAVQLATVRIEDRSHGSTAALDHTWTRTDEWYATRTNPRGRVHVLATVDESTYVGGGSGGDHPIAWCARIGEGRSFVTAMGHTIESWSEPAFVAHVTGGIVSVTQPGSCRGERSSPRMPGQD